MRVKDRVFNCLLRSILKFCNFMVAESLFAVACSPTDATLVATGGRDDRAFLWRIGQGDCSKELAGMFVYMCAISTAIG